MTRLAVISDSHWGRVRLEMVSRIVRAEQFDGIIHLGDGQSDAKWLEKETGVQVQFVAGNCDLCRDCPRELRQTMDGVRLLAVHGDKYNVKLELTTLSYYAEEACAQAALFGHTHQPFAGYVGRVLLVNPGSLAQGRYAELRLDHGQAVPFLKEF